MAWWQTAKVGDRVVCVKQPVVWSLGCPLTRGRVYKIEKLMVINRHSPVCFLIGGGYFAATYFRPVQPKSSESGVLALKKTAYLASLGLKIHVLSEAG